MFGILGAHIALNELLDKTTKREKITGTIWCDNKVVVKAFNKLTDITPFLTNANQNNSDVLQNLTIWNERIPATLTAGWVKLHKKMCKTKEA